MSKIYIYFSALCLIAIGFGGTIVNTIEFFEKIVAITENTSVIEIDNGVVFIPIFIACGTLGISFFKAFAIDDATDPRRSAIMNRQFIFMGVCLVLFPIGYFLFSYLCSAILEPKGYVAKTVYVGRSLYRVTEWRRPSSQPEPAK